VATLVHIAIWNVNCGVGGDRLTSLKNMTGQMSHQWRYSLLSEVVSVASELMRPSDPHYVTNYLRLFLAPEYLFAKSHKEHIFDCETRTTVLADLKALSSKYSDIIFFPGTIAFCKEFQAKVKDEQFTLLAKDKYGQMKDRSEKYEQLPNIRSFSGKKVFIAHNTAYVFHNNRRIYKYHKKGDAGEIYGDDELGGRLMFAGGARPNYFKYGDLTFGIEVCVDHASGWLLRSGIGVDIHIILSASTAFIEANTTVREGGIVCHADSDQEPAVYQKVSGKMEKLPTAAVVVEIGKDQRTNDLIRKAQSTVQKKLVREAETKYKLIKGDEDGYSKAINFHVEKFQTIMGGRLGIFGCTI